MVLKFIAQGVSRSEDIKGAPPRRAGAEFNKLLYRSPLLQPRFRNRIAATLSLAGHRCGQDIQGSFETVSSHPFLLGSKRLNLLCDLTSLLTHDASRFRVFVTNYLDTSHVEHLLLKSTESTLFIP